MTFADVPLLFLMDVVTIPVVHSLLSPVIVSGVCGESILPNLGVCDDAGMHVTSASVSMQIENSVSASPSVIFQLSFGLSAATFPRNPYNAVSSCTEEVSRLCSTLLMLGLDFMQTVPK